ncbi:MAG: hypothetical protein ACPG7W_06575 [Paracoccaceae bacterium]
MTLPVLTRLFLETLSAPRDAAVRLLGLGLRGEALWLAGALVVVLYPLSVAPQAAALVASGQMLAMMAHPMMALVLVGAQLLGTIVALWLACRLLGARPDLEGVAVLFIWVEALRVAAQFLASVFEIVGLSSLSGMLSIAVFVLGLWISVHFVDVLTGFGSLLKSFGAFFLGAMILTFAAEIGLRMMGLSLMEVMNNV